MKIKMPKRKKPEAVEEPKRLDPVEHYKKKRALSVDWPSEQPMEGLIHAYNDFRKLYKVAKPNCKDKKDKPYLTWLKLECTSHRQVIKQRVKNGEKIPKGSKINSKSLRKELAA